MPAHSATPESPSESIEMYLKALLELQSGAPVAIARLAERLGVTQISATEMIKRLAERDYVVHTPYKGVTLTNRGRQIASDVIRRQRLWEIFLHQHLGIAWNKVYELACSLEHATAPEVTHALASFLGQPQHSPYGDPIPDATGRMAELDGVALSELPVGVSAEVLAVQATRSDVLLYVKERGLLPGVTLKLLEVAPLDGPLTLAVDGQQVVLGRQIAEFILVQPLALSQNPVSEQASTAA